MIDVRNSGLVPEKCWYAATCLYLANDPKKCPHHLSGGKRNPESHYMSCVYFAKKFGENVEKLTVESSYKKLFY